MITKEIKDKWIQALRSGEYKQGFGQLNKEDKYCCIGVLCKVLEIPNDGYQITTDYTIKGLQDRKSEDLIYYPEIDDLIGYINVKTLAWQNDSRTSFDKIADWIEENL